MQTTIVGRSALVEGKAFDLQKVLTAHERLIDAFARRFGPSQLTTDHEAAQRRFAWPDPGRALARQTWTRMKELHDVVDEPLIHPMDAGITLKAYLLGKTWCVRNPRTGVVTTPHGEHLAQLDPSPTVCVYGIRQPGGSYGLVSEADMEAAQRIVLVDLAALELTFERSTINEHAAVKSGLTDYGYVRFPHDVYGAGRDWIRVRCVSSDGGEVDLGSDDQN